MTSLSSSSDQQPAVLLCPGQGAQAIGMGHAWAQASPIAQSLFRRADELLDDTLGQSLSSLCFSGPVETLNRTDVSQPALYVAAVASAMGSGASELPLAAAAGLSLGEYTALHLAGVLSFEDGLRLVALRGRAMQDAAEATPSGMVALIGADETSAQQVCDSARQGDVLVCANFNAPGQVVISGSQAACARAQQVATEMGLRATALQVAGAFHSPLMQPAADRLAAALAKTPLLPAKCPVLSNVTGVPHEVTPESIRARLVEQLTSPVRWSDNVTWLAAHCAQSEFFELAPGRTLAGLARRIDKALKIGSLDAPSPANPMPSAVTPVSA